MSIGLDPGNAYQSCVVLSNLRLRAQWAFVSVRVHHALLRGRRCQMRLRAVKNT